MSTVKVNEVRHLSNSGTANVVLESNATTNLQATSTLGLTVTGTLTVSGVSTFNGNTVVGNASSDTMVLTSTVSGFNNFSGFTGEIRMYAGNAAGDSPPAGWLYCNGDTISSTIDDGGTNLGGTHYNADGKGNDYQPLFNLLKASSDWGNTSSASWGTDKVKVPDFRSRSPVGMATGAANAADARTTGTALAAGLTSRTLGDVVGKETHPLVIAELATHTHVMTNPSSLTGTSISTITAGSHTHTSAGHSHAMAHTHNIATTETSTTSIPVSTLQSEYMYGRSGVTAGKIAVGGDNVGTGYGKAPMESHTHYFNVPAHATQGVSTANTSSTTPSATGGTAPSISGGALTDPQHTHISTAANTGSGTAHTILSPIIAVNYIIKV
jgi:microcystin-dependent protein